ncbi:hypothetical protein Tco_1568290 [Tanacetum coccineum]
MDKENVKDPVPCDLPVVQTYVPPTPILGHLKGQMGSPYRTRKTICMIGIPKEIHKIKDQEDEGDTDDGWDITVKDVERLRQILTPTIHTLPNLEPMFGEEFFDNTRVSKKIDSNPVNDLKELLKTYDFETFIRKLLHQVCQSSRKTGKTKREMKSHQRISQLGKGIRGLHNSLSCGKKGKREGDGQFSAISRLAKSYALMCNFPSNSLLKSIIPGWLCRDGGYDACGSGKPASITSILSFIKTPAACFKLSNIVINIVSTNGSCEATDSKRYLHLINVVDAWYSEFKGRQYV